MTSCDVLPVPLNPASAEASYNAAISACDNAGEWAHALVLLQAR